jgi:hypothetical protein
MLESLSVIDGTDTRFDPIHLPEPTIPLGFHSRKTPKRPKTWRLGLMHGPISPQF